MLVARGNVAATIYGEGAIKGVGMGLKEPRIAEVAMVQRGVGSAKVAWDHARHSVVESNHRVQSG